MFELLTSFFFYPNDALIGSLYFESNLYIISILNCCELCTLSNHGLNYTISFSLKSFLSTRFLFILQFYVGISGACCFRREFLCFSDLAVPKDICFFFLIFESIVYLIFGDFVPKISAVKCNCLLVFFMKKIILPFFLLS